MNTTTNDTIELGSITLRDHGNGHHIARKGKLRAYVRWDERGGQFQSPTFADHGGVDCANGWSECAVEYVARWVSPTTARKRLREEMEDF